MSIACAPIDPAEHLGLAGHLARRYLRNIPQGMEPDDVLQEARIGVLIAAQRFDPARGTTFGTYAVHEAGIETKIGCHTLRATGITNYLERGGTLERAQQMANHESARTTKPYDQREDRMSLDEVERISI